MVNEVNSVSEHESCNPIIVFVYSEETKDSVIPPNVTHVKVDPCVKEIRENAFRKLTSLVQVEFSKGRLEVIGGDAFAKCTKLRHTNQLPSTLKQIGSQAFFGCCCLETLVLPQGLKNIGSAAFYGCRTLKEIKIPSSKIEIHIDAFAQCHSLTSIELPDGLQFIGERWFKGCSALVAIEIPSSVIEIHGHAFSNCKKLAAVHFPEGLEYIGDMAFVSCKSIDNVHLPVTLRRVGRGVFLLCDRLKSCILPEGLTMIGDKMFSGCRSMTHLAIPETVTSIGAQAFSSCTNLQHVRVPSSVVRVGRHAFMTCEQLKSAKIESDSLTLIAEGVFQWCVSLTHLRLPSSITKIEGAAFSGCRGLVSTEFPKGLEEIFIREDDFFHVLDAIDGCGSLVNLVVPAAQQVYLDGVMAMAIDGDAMGGLQELSHVSRAYHELIPIMQHRFDNKPVHELCYYQSYYSVEETRQNLNQAIHEDPSTVLDVDAFGMTPFHILALSQTPMLPLFEALLDLHDADITALVKDKFGKSPMDYLCMNHIPESATVSRSLLRNAINKRTQWLGLDRWRNEIMTAMDEAIAADWSLRRQEIEFLIVKVAELERMEAISLLELAIWSMKMAEQDSDDRQSCRIRSGADVIISNTLPFLDKVSG